MKVKEELEISTQNNSLGSSEFCSLCNHTITSTLEEFFWTDEHTPFIPVYIVEQSPSFPL